MSGNCCQRHGVRGEGGRRGEMSLGGVVDNLFAVWQFVWWHIDCTSERDSTRLIVNRKC